MDSETPNPAHLEADSMLARKFGKETVHYFAGSPLNRVSFLRSDSSFLSAALRHKSTKFLLFNQLAPLTRSISELYFACFKEVEPVVPSDLFEKTEEEVLKSFDSRNASPLVVFLGLGDSQAEDGLKFNSYQGVPHFAIDITPKGSYESQSKTVIQSLEAKGLSFDTSRIVSAMSADHAAIFAQSRALIDWNTRNAFCGACGHPTIPVEAGGKRACPPTDLGLVASGTSTDGCKPPCHTRNTISNLSFPRTDPTIIAAVISHDGKRILLGRGKRYPPNWYSTLAGFIEAGESVEDAVRREIWEEAGVILARVIIHSTQPWPYPANLMIGAIGQVASPEHETIRLDHDPELEDAKWFDIAVVEEALKNGTSSLGDGPGPNYKEGALRLPPKTAIAHHLISAAINDEFLKPFYAPKI